MTRRLIVWIGVIALFATSLFSPYNFTGQTGIVDPQFVSGTVLRPVWGGAPKSGAFDYLPTSSGKSDEVYVRDVQLDSAKLGLWWFGIALVSGAALLLTRDSKA